MTAAEREVLGSNYTSGGLDSNAPYNRWFFMQGGWKHDKDMWTIWGTTSVIGALSSLVVFLALMKQRNMVNKNPFKQFVVCLTFVDFFFTASCVQCLVNLSLGRYEDLGYMCDFQGWYIIFGFGGSMYVNCFIGRAVHHMLVASVEGKHYIIPTPLHVTLQCMLAYVTCGVIGLLPIIPSFPIRYLPLGGGACFPLASNYSQMLFFWLVFVTMFVGVPLVYLIYLLTHLVWIKAFSRLAKMSGDAAVAKALGIFFSKLLIVYLVMWLPAIFTIWIFGGEGDFLWAAAFGGGWSHLQAAVSAYFYTQDPQIRAAVMNLLCCGKVNAVENKVDAEGRTVMFSLVDDEEAKHSTVTI